MTLVSQVGSCVVAGLTLYCSLIDGGRNVILVIKVVKP